MVSQPAALPKSHLTTQRKWTVKETARFRQHRLLSEGSIKMLSMAVLRLQWFGGIFFGVLLHGVDGLTRTACAREAQFDNPKKGKTFCPMSIK